MKANELITLIQGQSEEDSTLEKLNELIDAKLSADGTEEAEETSEEETEEETEEVSEEASEETEETPEEEETEEAPADVNLSAIMGIINDLRTENESLRQQLSETQAALSAKNKAEKDFIAKFKNLSVSIREEEKPVETKHHQFGMTNGIGEL